MNRFLTVDEVVAIHDELSDAPVIDVRKLEGAVMRPQSTYYGVYLHASIYEQASVLLSGICQAHGFLDGNKRTAWVSTLTFLDINGLTVMEMPQEGVVTYMESVAEGLYSDREVARFIFSVIEF